MLCCCKKYTRFLITPTPAVSVNVQNCNKSLEEFVTAKNDIIENKINQTFLKSGGFGSIFTYTNSYNNKKLVEKRGKPKHLKRALLEAETLIKLQGIYSPNFYFFDKNKTYTNLTMEYIPGEDLFEYYTNNVIDISLVNTIIIRIILALIHCFERGFMHLDLKLENIMYDNNTQRLVLIDWATCHPSVNQCSNLKFCVGTPDYSAPEIFYNYYNHTSDIYSFGCIYWILLTGVFPYTLSQQPRIHTQMYESFPPTYNKNKFNSLTKQQQKILQITLEKNCKKRVTYNNLLNELIGL